MQADFNNLCICLTIENNSSKNHSTKQYYTEQEIS